MKTHIRVDSVKVFEDGVARLERVMKKTKSKTKTEAYNKALDFIDTHYEQQLAILAAMSRIEKAVHEGNRKTNESLEDIYFKLSTVIKPNPQK